MNDPTEILQALHDSGVSATIKWFVGGEVQWAIGDAIKGWKVGGTSTNVRSAILELADNACTEFPESRFLAWWAQQRGIPHALLSGTATGRGRKASYRAFFTVGGHIVRRHEFNAENDEIAVLVAEKVFDACSEACDGLEIWNSGRRIGNLKPPMLQSLIEKSHELIAKSAEARIRGEKILANAEEISETSTKISAAAIALIEELAIKVEEALTAGDWRFAVSPRLRTKLAELSRRHPASEWLNGLPLRVKSGRSDGAARCLLSLRKPTLRWPFPAACSSDSVTDDEHEGSRTVWRSIG